MTTKNSSTSVARQGTTAPAVAAPRPKTQADLNAEELRHYLKKMEGDLGSALRGHVPLDWFTRVALTVYRTGGKGKLIQCSPLSVVAALFEGAQMGLSPDPNLGEFWLIPRSGVATFQIGYQGLLKIARRSGEIGTIRAGLAYAGDHLVIRGGTHCDEIDHEPNLDGEFKHEDIRVAYAVAWMKGMSRDIPPYAKWVPRAKLVLSAERSGNPGDKSWSDVWKKHFDQMALKVALARLCKILPRTDELAMALARDELREEGREPESVITLEQGPSATGYAQTNSNLDALVPGGQDFEIEQPAEFDRENGEVSPDELPDNLGRRS